MKLTAEQVREAIFNGSSYASYDGAKYYADGINMQAIADELDTRAERTCKLGGEVPAFDMTLNMLADIPWYWCLECGAATPSISNYCMHCGAKVVDK